MASYKSSHKLLEPMLQCQRFGLQLGGCNQPRGSSSASMELGLKDSMSNREYSRIRDEDEECHKM